LNFAREGALLAEDFVHLHVHSEYSLLDGSIRVKKLLKELSARGAKACAITDHDGMHGLLEFYLDAQKSGGLNPIMGYEANVQLFSKSLGTGTGHIVLLAENNEGYRNLIKLCSIANTSGVNSCGPSTVAVTWEDVRAHAAGVICLTASLKGELSTLVRANAPDEACLFLENLVGVFGKDNVFVEICENNLPAQKGLTPRLVELAKSMGLGYVATADVHYLKESDKETHLSLMAIKHKLHRSDLRDVDTSYEFHLATFEEMQRRFSDYPEALEATKTIADRCKVHIDTKSIFMPDYRQRPEESADDCLERLSREGLAVRKADVQHWMKDKFSEETWKKLYEERLEYELGVILKMKFAGYFLIVQDFINWAKDHGIPVGPGRGSAAGSLVTYALRITNIDPIRFDLLFERFLNPERISMPDIDTDFCQDRRGEVLNYVYGKYGEKAVAQIVTFGRMKARNAIKNLARILDWSFNEANEFAQLVPESPDMTLEKAIKEDERLKARLETDERAKSLWDEALQVEGVLASLGIHAAGVIISDSALDERCPLMESEGQLLTQFEYKLAEKIGLIKFDFLGLKTLTVIETALQMIRKNREPQFDIEKVDVEDPAVYKMLSTAHVTGVFQLESNGMRKLLADLKPTCFSDIVAVLALFRPGPLGSGMVEDFVKRKHGEVPVEYPFPELEEILRDTYGVIVYQEQVQKIAVVLASYTLGEADLLRRAMGKKDKAEMEKQKARFVSGAEKNGHNPERVSEFFDLIAKFAEYGFNKSHSAAYGYVTFQTAYLKTYYPTEFMAAIMSLDLDNTDKIITYVRDCRRMGIAMLPPSVNGSQFGFSIPAEKTIQFGLGAIKGLGRGVVDALVEERQKNGAYLSVPDFIARVDARKLNKKVMESLTLAGAFDCVATNRAEIMANADGWLKAIAKEVECSEQAGEGLFGLFGGMPTSAPQSRSRSAALSSSSPGDGIEANRLAEMRRKKYGTYFPLSKQTTLDSINSVSKFLMGIQIKKTKPWSLSDQLKGEMQTLGFYMTAHPVDVIREDVKALSQVSLDSLVLHLEKDDVPKFKRKTVKLAGVAMDVQEKKNKDNERFGVVKIEDGLGSVEMMIFAKQYAALARKPQKGDCIWAECRLSKGIEAGSVRAECVELAFVAEKRLEALKGLVFLFDAAFEPTPENLAELKNLVEKSAGNVPLVLDVLIPAERRCLRMKMPAVNPSDEFLAAVEAKWPGLIFVHRCYSAAELFHGTRS
jgi:DNA polymerase-3 subunit alpha